MGENIVLDLIEDLHAAMYARMASIVGITGCEFGGFDSGRTTPPLPQIGMKIGLDDIQVDRGRMTPNAYARLEINSGVQKDYSYGGVVYQDKWTERVLKFPLPIVLTYNIWTWCHSSQTALLMDQKLQQKFPERGILSFVINTVAAEFPITLVRLQNLDDLTKNLRERIYQYQVEAWIEGSLPDEERKIITTPIMQVYSGNTLSDAVIGNLIDEVKLEPDP